MSGVIGFSIPTEAASIGFYEWEGSTSFHDGEWSEMKVATIFYDYDTTTPYTWTDPFLPFGFINFSTGTIGNTYILDSTSPNFAVAANHVTNGLNDNIGTLAEYGVNYAVWGKSGVIENALRREPGNAVSWYLIPQGSTVSYMEFTVVDFSSEYNSDIQSSRANYTYRVDIYDAVPAPVPEPSTILLVATGLVGLAGFRKKFKK